MGFSHYPKVSGNLVFAWRLPRPPVKDPFPGFLSFDEVNLAKGPLGVGETFSACHDGIGFTRLFFTVKCTQPLEIVLSFSDDEVDDEGNPVTDDNLSKLDYYVEAKRHLYDPTKHERTCKWFAIVDGRWLRIEIKNTGDKPVKSLKAYLRGSVF